MTEISDETYFDALVDFVHRQRGIDFASYKASTLRRRIGKRMQDLGIDSYSEYLDRLQASPEEFVPLLEALFINVTSFFRDPEAWDVLRASVMPDLAARVGREELRVWCAGVASGEEVYTVAMLLLEHVGMENFLTRVKIFATDLDDGALLQARTALYSREIVEDVPVEMREKYFEPVGSRFQFRSEYRRVIIFGRHNLLDDAPISKVHLLACRNTLMYFSREAQGKILGRFHFALRPDGYLFMGKSEMLLTRRNLFAPVDGKARLFRKISDLSFRDRLSAITHGDTEEDESRQVLGEVQLRDLAFDTSPVAELVVDGAGRLALANRTARFMFRIGRHEVGRPFQDLEVSYKPLELRGPTDQVRRNHEAVEIPVVWSDAEGVTKNLEVRVEPLFEDGNANAVKIRFLDVSRYHALAEELSHSKRELEVAYEELQSSNEELETTNEELQSTVEELETTNEELQSSNEELETMNEELQSTNVELEAVNEELHERTDELGRVNQYVSTILNSLHTAFVVMDRNYEVRIWNEAAERLWGLRADDVEGKSFTSLDIGLPVGQLKETLRRCLSGEEDQIREHIEGHDRRGKAVSHVVRCVPLREGATEISGVIVLVDARGEDEPI